MVYRTMGRYGQTAVACITMVVAIAGEPLMPCSTFSFSRGGRAYLAGNYDFYYGHGIALKNPRGLIKQGLVDGRPAHWRARYGSVTLNQFGRELPVAGMNERGLAIQLMWHEGGRFPRVDSRPAVNELQWIQYQLDRHATVAAVARNIHRVRPQRTLHELHYHLCDRSGDCALIEFVRGRASVRRLGKNLPVRALTNSSYAESLQYRELYRQRYGRKLPTRVTSLDRFVVAAHEAESYSAGVTPSTHAFAGLRRLAIPYRLTDLFLALIGRAPSVTQWSVLHAPGRLRLSFRTRAVPKLRSIALADLDFRCRAGLEVLDLDRPSSDRLRAYQARDNRRVVELSFAPVRKAFPLEQQEEMLRGIEAMRCR